MAGIGGVDGTSGDLWVAGQSPDGTLRLVRDGEASTLTALVDRGLPVETQGRDLHGIEWAPPAVLAATIDATSRPPNGLPEPPDLPPGWLASPFSTTVPEILAEGGEPRHPVRDWFWPALSNHGEPVLEEGERVEEILVPSSSSLIAHRDLDDGAGAGQEVSPVQIKDERCFLTNKRVIRIARRDPESMHPEDQRVWAVSHLRWIWIHELGTMRMMTIEKRNLLSRRRPGPEREAAYFRFRLPDMKTTFELRSYSPSPQKFYDRALDLCALEAERDVGQTHELEEESADTRIVRLATPVSGAVPYSMPETMSSDRPPRLVR